MAADPLDGDVRRLRFSGSRGSNGDPIGYRPVRTEDMNDEAFNLTPHDIRKQDFRKTLRGYDTLGVDDFRVRVADAEVVHAQRVVPAQGFAKVLLADVVRRQVERFVVHVLGPNRTVPNRITVAPS